MGVYSCHISTHTSKYSTQPNTLSCQMDTYARPKANQTPNNYILDYMI